MGRLHEYCPQHVSYPFQLFLNALLAQGWRSRGPPLESLDHLVWWILGYRRIKGHTLIQVGIYSTQTTQPVETVNDATWSASCAFSAGSSDAAKCLQEIANSLQTGEIELVMYHSKAAPGQVRDFSVMNRVYGADMNRGRTSRIVNIATKHGLRATFAPRVMQTRIGLNCSIMAGTAARSHISIHPTAQPRSSNANTNKDTGTTPLERIASGHVERTLAGGEDNKDVAIHLTGPLGFHHLEVCTNDGTALTTVLGLGLVGVEKGLELKIWAADRPAVSCSPNWDGTVDVAYCTLTNKDGLEVTPPVKSGLKPFESGSEPLRNRLSPDKVHHGVNPGPQRAHRPWLGCASSKVTQRPQATDGPVIIPGAGINPGSTCRVLDDLLPYGRLGLRVRGPTGLRTWV
ncbi:hypothetical protein EDB83DRAFT_2321090 [Lactarius deliciosus]|nr:hypothetical protein EDB83DRAFT_2321090 [Lactarius deliciosus]